MGWRSTTEYTEKRCYNQNVAKIKVSADDTLEVIQNKEILEIIRKQDLLEKQQQQIDLFIIEAQDGIWTWFRQIQYYYLLQLSWRRS